MDQMQQTPQTPAGNPGEAPREEKSVGALIGSIIVIVIIILGGIYFWMTRQSSTEQTPAQGTATDQSVAPDQQTAALLDQGTSSDISSIEKDLNATDLNNLYAEMSNIDSQLK
jgi:uncharacterized protein HemX